MKIPESWESVEIGDILTLGGGRDYKHLDVGDIPVYGTGGYMTSVNEYLYNGESVGIGRKGTIDKPVFLKGKFWTVDTLFYTHSFKNTTPYFVYILFQNINWRKYSEATGVPSLSRSIIEPIKINLPPLPEQQKIAEILSTVDAKIEIVDQQIAETQELKKGLMQQLLTKGIGHTEFKDSALGKIPKSWEVNKIGETCHSFAGGTPKRSVKEYYKNGTIPWVKSGEVDNDNITSTKESVTELAINETSTRLIKSKSILVALYGATAGKVGVLKMDACSNQAVLAINSNVDFISNKFLYHFLKSITKTLLVLCQGSGQPNLSKKIIDNVNIPIPQKGEQRHISEILTSVDNKLEVLSEKKTTYQEMKQGLMQQLLTRKVRV